MKKPSALPYLAPVGATLALAAAAAALFPGKPRMHPGMVAIITGGSRGLGLALAHRFGRAGLKLVLAARNREELDRARAELLSTGDVAEEDDVLLVVCDLTDASEAAQLVAAAVRTFGRLDVLINNAGIIEVGPVEDQPLAAYERAMQTNFFAALYMVHAALPHLLEQNDAHERAIVNIASVGGKVAVPHLLPYVAAKFALTGFSEGLHAELRFKGVRVTTVCPGLLRTGGEQHAHFIGKAEKEERWFKLSARTPGIAADASAAADKIFSAVSAGRAEITITPQAWLAARLQGLLPETVQALAAVANLLVLPNPVTSLAPPAEPFVSPLPASKSEPFVDPSPS